MDCVAVVSKAVLPSLLIWFVAAWKEETANMTEVLNLMLEGYDRRLRPGMGGSPVEVKANIYLRSMDAISEQDMAYSMDCYFRQKWKDDRLSLRIPIENVSLSNKVLERIWYPDTIFFNDHNSYVHTITTQNRFIRINRDGSILFSQRLTIRASCKMTLEKFPMDTQQCPLHFGSFAYTSVDVLYNWTDVDSVQLDQSLTLSQFDLVKYPFYNDTSLVRGGMRSILSVTFILKRQCGFFLIQAYLPCALLVVLSWVSFWINREATSDRITLGTTTFLTMTFLGIDQRNDLPKVSYTTALDNYIAVCFLFVVSTIVQFAVVHYHTKHNKGDLPLIKDSDASDNDKSEDDGDGGLRRVKLAETRRQVNGKVRTTRALRGFQRKAQPRARGVWKSFKRMTRGGFVGFKKKKQSEYRNSVSKVDQASRVLFPLVFVIFNITYWISYVDWNVDY